MSLSGIQRTWLLEMAIVSLTASSEIPSPGRFLRHLVYGYTSVPVLFEFC